MLFKTRDLTEVCACMLLYISACYISITHNIKYQHFMSTVIFFLCCLVSLLFACSYCSHVCIVYMFACQHCLHVSIVCMFALFVCLRYSPVHISPLHTYFCLQQTGFECYLTTMACLPATHSSCGFLLHILYCLCP